MNCIALHLIAWYLSYLKSVSLSLYKYAIRKIYLNGTRTAWNTIKPRDEFFLIKWVFQKGLIASLYSIICVLKLTSFGDAYNEFNGVTNFKHLL